MKIRPKKETPRENFINQLTKGPCTVVFTKVDGSVRRMPATLHHSLIPEDQTQPLKGVDVNESSDKTRKVSEDTVVCFDLEKQAWRSFRVDSVITFEPAMRVET